MDSVSFLLGGFAVALEPINLLFCFVGCVLGTLVGVLPGLGPAAAMSLLLPITFSVTPVGAIIMLSGIFYGAMYGGSITSILVNIPGEAASVVTCLDGYQMARQGRAGPALGMSAFASFIAGTIGILGLTFVAPPMVKLAIKFGPPEYFSLMCLGLVVLTFLSSKSMINALMMACLGLLTGMIGTDTVTGAQRFTFGISDLYDGAGIVPVIMGLFGISELLLNLEAKFETSIITNRVTNLFPTLQDWSRSKWAILRGTLIGFFLGVLPGGGATLSSFVSYALEKKVSSHPEKFGTGMIEGVASPEAANNCAAQASFIPLLTLGIPANAFMAMLLGALLIHGVTPGPMMYSNNPEIFWGLIASMYVGNLLLLILNIPLIGLWIQILKVPYAILMPMIVLFCTIGAYSANSNITDIFVMLFFGAAGYLMKKLSFDAPAFILAFVLGPMLENSLRQALIISRGDLSIFVNRPISLACLAFAGLLLAWSVFGRKKLSQLPADD